jgi:hypothetical protein
LRCRLINVRTNRYVVTYTPDQWPVGFLTGYDDEAGGWALEHVVAFDQSPKTLLALVRLGLQEAWARGFQYVTFHVPKTFPHARQLTLLGLRLGFEEYGHDDRHEHYVCHRPPDAEAGHAVDTQAAGARAGG